MSAIGQQVNLGLRLLDDQLLDSDDHRCGRVDDVQLRGMPGSRRSEITALLVGSGAWTERLRRPFGQAVAGLAPGYMHVVPWGEVTRIGTAVRLSKPAKELGLESSDGRNVQWIGAPPRGTFRLSELLRSRLVTTSGSDLGRIWEVRAERQTEVPDEQINEAWRVIGLLIGRPGLQERIGVSIEGDPVPSANFIAWNAVQDLAPGVVTVSDTAGT
jgi:sporulation protein YlmC with PRC-barrel domain